MAEGVKLLLVVAGVAAAEVIVRGVDASTFTQQSVNYLVFLAVRCKDHWGEVMRESVGMYTHRNIKSIYI